MSSSSLESDSILRSTGSSNYDSDSDTGADDNSNKKNAKKSHFLLNLLLLRRHHLSRRRPKFAPKRLVWKDDVSQLVHQTSFLLHSVCLLLPSTSWWRFFWKIWRWTNIKHFDLQTGMVQFYPNCLLPCPCNGWQVVNGQILKKCMVSRKVTSIAFAPSS